MELPAAKEAGSAKAAGEKAAGPTATKEAGAGASPDENAAEVRAAKETGAAENPPAEKRAEYSSDIEFSSDPVRSRPARGNQNDDNEDEEPIDDSDGNTIIYRY
ncbi:hypothetical protein VE04_01544 [Pseudogymnoascus sp. 24MN13]|nr:hypothetical protein VE04_01544 [Pseudogymnoascus sp. 24MN13]